MTDEQALQKYEDMLKFFNGRLPNPIHEPITFAYHVKLFDYFTIKGQEQNVE